MMELHDTKDVLYPENKSSTYNEDEPDDTISDLNTSITAAERPITSLARNLSEMSIEGSTAESPALDNQDNLLQEKVKTVFELPDDETLLNEFPCYLIRLVTIPGWMYVTNNYVCFYASLPGKKKGPYKGGYLSKKNHITLPASRYYFELQNHVLSWYHSAETKYLPINSVDLKCITAIEPSKYKKYGIRLSTDAHHYTVIADSELSQKEWMDELRKGVFVAQHAGNSVRIVLPFSKVALVEKPSVFQFAANIKIKFMDDESQEDYYFAFFPDIQCAYEEIVAAWKTQSSNGSNSAVMLIKQQVSTMKTGSTSFLSFDNISPAALPTMLMGKLMNVTNLFQNTTTAASPTVPDDVVADSSDEGDNDLVSSPSDIPSSTSYWSSNKSKRNSLFFGRSESTQDAGLPPPLADSTTASRPRSGTINQLTKIPRAVTDAIKHQIKSDDQTPPRSNQTPRPRSGSFNALKNHIPSFNLYHKNNKDSTSSIVSATTTISSSSNGDISLVPTSPKAHRRTSSIGSKLIQSGTKTWHKLTPSTGDAYYQQQHLNEQTHRHPKGSVWLNGTLIKELEAYPDSSDPSEDEGDSDSNEEVEVTETPLEREQEQHTMNEHLNANFPMLLKTETAQAVFKASFWKTIPYSGKIYITDHFFCFNSRILAGSQKLIVPWKDVLQIKKLKSKSYYLLHGMTMAVKDLTDEICFDFGSISIRDHCYAVCELKRENNMILLDSNSITSKRSHHDALSMSSIILDRHEHIEPPLEYDGPPLLSSAVNHTSTQKYSPPEKSLHFTCLTIGSRGDVQPYLALCKELQKDGHRCRIATHPEYEDWITHHGIEFRSVGGDPGELMKLCIDNSFLSVSFIKEGTKFFYSWFEALLQSSYDACQGTDVIIESPSAMIGVHIAEKLGVPFFRSMPFPFTRTTRFPHPFAVAQTTAGGRIYNDMTYVMIDMALWAGTAKYVNRFRRKVLHLPSTTLDKLALDKVPYIYSFSPSVVHPPKDWSDYIHVTGYWFLDNPDQKWKPDPALLTFLHSQDKRPIVYIGFGSIIVPDAQETTRLIVQAVLESDVRAIICKGWSTRGNDTEGEEMLLHAYPETIHQLDSVPHDWLFPQIQGVVHHGGAGTTAAGLRAGLPTVIKPFFGDQRFWGQRVEDLQVGVCLNKLTKNALKDALITITQKETMMAKANLVGQTIRKENGPRNAVECIYREYEYAKDQRKV